MEKLKELNCILLVDDDDATNFYNQLIIEDVGIGVPVQVVQTGEEALEFLTNTGRYNTDSLPKPGLILLDINMPLMNGWEFLEEYLKLPDSLKKNIAMAMLTSSINLDDITNAATHPDIVDIFQKPLKEEDLKSMARHFNYPVAG